MTKLRWQDLNDAPIKRYWKYGRAWWGRLSAEWCIPTSHWIFEFGANGGDSHHDLTFCLGCGLFYLHLSIRAWAFPIGHWSTYSKEPFFLHEERTFRLAWHNWTLWLNLWHEPMGSSEGRRDHWLKRTWTFSPMDALFGCAAYRERVLETGETLIPMIEGCYPATYKLFVSAWSCPRWPFKRELARITLDVPKGIPMEGKGENSYDCGEDATFGITCQASTVEQGIGDLVASVLRDRRKYGRTHQHRGLQP